MQAGVVVFPINRSLPIALEQIGDIANRVSPIGDPRHEFLPANREGIEAELCGMIEVWKAAECPLDESIKHPMRQWARVIGGILKANGFANFLGNWSLQRSINDSEREALALIAHASPPNQWLRISMIAKTGENQGVMTTLMDARQRESDCSKERQLGVLLSAHRDETLHIEVDDTIKAYVIRRARNGMTGKLATVYLFEPVELPNQSMTATVGQQDTVTLG